MSDHNSAVFNNSCLKVPRNPVSNQPYPTYEQKRFSQFENHNRKLNNDELNLQIKTPSESNSNILKSFIEFYDSIPEYDEINHLSNKEFYRRLENLREKQRRYYEKLRLENKNTEWMDDYKNLNISGKKSKTPTPRIKPFCGTPIVNKSPNINKRIEDVESIYSSDKEIATKPSSRRSVRIESPIEKYTPDEYTPEPYQRSKSRASSTSKRKDEFCNNSSIWNEFDIDDFKLELDKESRMESRSVPNSPTKNKPSVGWKDSITIPQPFQMTVRDEENKIVEEVLATTTKPKEEKPEMFKANPVPIESQIPLFEKIMADQERRSHIIKNRRKAELLSNMQPFSFTKREEELQALTKRLSKSSPSIFLEDPPMKAKKFKAKPIPKNLFSNYIYKKMNEDEFYRALQKKIRAEEMLKASSLPPSMAKREKTKPRYDICPKSCRDLDTDSEKSKTRRCRSAKYNKLEQELEDLKNEFIGASPRNFKMKKSGRRARSARRNYSAGSRSSDNTPTDFSGDLEPINRSNLAAVLRIQSARKRMEMEMVKRLEESRLKEEARWKEKLMRKRPVWEALAYSHEEDLSMRLQLRREEEKLRSEDHKLSMQMMLGRVNQQPTLFERQSYYNHPKMGEELLARLLKERANSSIILNDSSGQISRTDIRDEAVQVHMDEEMNQYAIRKENGEGSFEEKEKCESFSDADDID